MRTDKYRPENSPLQIRTDSVLGSDEEVRLWFYNSGSGSYVGGVYLYFSSPPKYYLEWCSDSKTEFPIELPPETDKVWTIFHTRTSDETGIAVHCNNVEVLNVVISDTTCSDSDWNSIWSKDVDYTHFYSFDTASDYYRPGKYTNYTITQLIQI